MLKNKKFSVETAIDSILSEETVGNFGNNTDFFGKKPTLTKTDKHVKLQKRKDIAGTVFGSEIQCEEDAEEDTLEKISSIVFDSPNGISIMDIEENPMLINISTREIMRALQILSNKKKVKIENNIVRPVFNEDAEEDSDDMGKIIDEIIDNETENPLEDAILSVLDDTVSGSVSGMSTKEIIKAVRDTDSSLTKPQIINAIKELMKQGKIVKGPIEGTLIINSVDNSEDEEIPTGVIRSSQPSSTKTQENQALTNGETKETLKAKGWKENTPNVFTSPDGKEKFALTAESKNLKLNKIMNTYKDDAFFALCEEVQNEIDKIENGYDMPEDDTTAGLDELHSDATADDTEEDAYTITLTKSEYDLFKSIAEKIMAAADDAEDDDTEDDDTDEFTTDEATDEEANADLMSSDDDDVNFDDEEDAEESLDDSGNGVYDGSFSNGAPSLAKSTPAYGPARRAPITSKHLSPKGGQAYDGAQNAGAPRMSKQTPEYKSKSGKPVQSKQTSAAGTQKSLFEI